MAGTKTKKMINSVNMCVDDNITGLLAIHTGLRKVAGHRVIVRSDLEEYVTSGKVAILTGGGSGHEPAFAGYVGRGMATGAVMGDIFASPSSSEVFAAINALGKNNPAGVFVVYNNYTGDRLNFGIAVERACARGIRVTMLTNADDCALITADKTAGRRGLAGLILIIKIAGALAEEGRSLEEVTAIAQRVREGMGTLGLCLTPCSVPGMGKLFEVDHDKMELGLGLHGEAGVKTIKMMTAGDTVGAMIDHMINPTNNIRVSIKYGDEIAVLMNNLGATSDLEMNILANETINYLESKNVKVLRCYMNRFATSQEMAGFSITILVLNGEFKRCLDANARAVGWVEPLLQEHIKDRIPCSQLHVDDVDETTAEDNVECIKVDPATSVQIRQVLLLVCEQLIANREQLNQLDSGCGDGDCGSTLCQGANAIKDNLQKLPMQYPQRLFLRLASLSEQAMGGSSGALYGLFFTAAAPCLASSVGMEAWLAAFKAGMEAIHKYGGAEPGDRTMLDPLASAFSALEKANEDSISPTEALRMASKAGWEGAQATANMRAHAGRASYVSASKLQSPDPGAWAVALCLGAIADVINAQNKC